MIAERMRRLVELSTAIEHSSFLLQAHLVESDEVCAGRHGFEEDPDIRR